MGYPGGAFESAQDQKDRGLADVAQRAGSLDSPTDALLARQDVQDYLAASQEEDFEVSLVPLSQWQLAWRRFRKHRLALVGSVIVGVMVFIAIFGPLLWPYDALNLAKISRPGGIRRHCRTSSARTTWAAVSGSSSSTERACQWPSAW